MKGRVRESGLKRKALSNPDDSFDDLAYHVTLHPLRNFVTARRIALRYLGVERREGVFGTVGHLRHQQPNLRKARSLNYIIQ